MCIYHPTRGLCPRDSGAPIIKAGKALGIFGTGYVTYKLDENKNKVIDEVCEYLPRPAFAILDLPFYKDWIFFEIRKHT